MAQSSASVAAIVQPYLAKYPAGDITFSLDAPENIQQVNDWWRVGIRPSRWPERITPVLESLAEIEEALRDDQHLNILLSLGDPVNAEDIPEAASR